jgi:hypothetical protein
MSPSSRVIKSIRRRGPMSDTVGANHIDDDGLLNNRDVGFFFFS